MYEFIDFTLSIQKRVLIHIPQLKFPDHGIVLLKGENGTGKTTYLNCLAFLNRNYKGKMLFCGNDRIKERQKEEILATKISYIRQKNNAISFLNAKENRNLLSILKGEKVEKKGGKMTSLSQGQQMILILEREFSTDKKVFLMDECFSSLDVHNKEKLKTEILRKKEECLFIIVSHEGDLEKEANHIYVLQGKQWRTYR